MTEKDNLTGGDIQVGRVVGKNGYRPEFEMERLEYNSPLQEAYLWWEQLLSPKGTIVGNVADLLSFGGWAGTIGLTLYGVWKFTPVFFVAPLVALLLIGIYGYFTILVTLRTPFGLFWNALKFSVLLMVVTAILI